MPNVPNHPTNVPIIKDIIYENLNDLHSNLEILQEIFEKVGDSSTVHTIIEAQLAIEKIRVNIVSHVPNL